MSDIDLRLRKIYQKKKEKNGKKWSKSDTAPIIRCMNSNLFSRFMDGWTDGRTDGRMAPSFIFCPKWIRHPSSVKVW